MPDFFGYMNRILNLQANTNLMNQEAAGQQILAQERALDVKLRQQQTQDEMIGQQRLASLLSGNQPQKVVDGQVQESGDPLINSLNRQMTRDQQTAQTARKFADAVSADPRVSMDYRKKVDDDANAKERVAIASVSAYRLAQNDLAKHLGSIGGSALDAHDDEGLQQALTQLSVLDPQRVKMMNLDRDSNNIPIWGPKSAREMRMLRDQGMDASQQATMAHQLEMDREAQARAGQAAAREQRLTDAADVAAAATRALTDERRAKTEQIRAKTEQLKTVASKPATKEMVNAARSSIKSTDDWKDAPFDSTVDAFAADVADHANKLRAEANQRGEDIGLDDAREEAIRELSGFVMKSKAGEHEVPGVVPFLGGKKFGGDERYTYTRGGKPPSSSKPATTAEQPKTADEYLKSIGVQ